MFSKHTALRRAARPLVAGSMLARIQQRTFIARRPKVSGRAVEKLNLGRMAQEADDYSRNRRMFLWAGAIAGSVSFVYTAYKLTLELTKPIKADSAADPANWPSDRKVVVQDADGHALVPTGNSTVPTFPRTLRLPSYTSPLSTNPPTDGSVLSTPEQTTEYTLVGLGLRTVTFIGIEVYVVGYYVATADIASLQAALVKRVNPIATTLVPGERDQLRADLLDPAQSEKIWDELLLARGIPARSAFRVVPVRDTDFHHLRDGFVRAIKARAPRLSGAGGGDDEAFGEAVKQFRTAFNRGKVPKKKELLMVRDEMGKLSIAYQSDGSKAEGRPAGRALIGIVEDERISRALWLNYLAGASVASEPARKSITEGIMDFVERPVGTVASQVIPTVSITA